MIAIIDYGAGNTKSVKNALDRLKEQYVLTRNSDVILNADKVVLPGVGHARHAMKSLQDLGLVDVIRKVNNPLLGICVGMQLLYEYSEEGGTPCLGIIEGKVKRFADSDLDVPLIGWNTVRCATNSLFTGLPETPWFYGVHSYYAEVGGHTIAVSDYDVQYSAAVQKDNFYGTQFHPEKSSKDGNLLLKNFIEL